jgi:NAD(P) transhydrogenase
VIACEYASIFAALGVQVTIIDRYERPLGFLDAELTQRFVRSFEARGGRFGSSTLNRGMVCLP